MSNNARKIFVLYHRGLRTGGPEALHQLVSTLRELGQDAYLVPHYTTAATPRVAQYSMYDAPEAEAIEDMAGNIVVVPETFIEDVFPYKRAKKMIWWLSIDNGLPFMGERLWQRTNRGLPTKIRETWVPFLRMLKHGDTPFQMRRRRDITHLVQSS